MWFIPVLTVLFRLFCCWHILLSRNDAVEDTVMLACSLKVDHNCFHHVCVIIQWQTVPGPRFRCKTASSGPSLTRVFPGEYVTWLSCLFFPRSFLQFCIVVEWGGVMSVVCVFVCICVSSYNNNVTRLTAVFQDDPNKPVPQSILSWFYWN